MPMFFSKHKISQNLPFKSLVLPLLLIGLASDLNIARASHLCPLFLHPDTFRAVLASEQGWNRHVKDHGPLIWNFSNQTGVNPAAVNDQALNGLFTPLTSELKTTFLVSKEKGKIADIINTTIADTKWFPLIPNFKKSTLPETKQMRAIEQAIIPFFMKIRELLDPLAEHSRLEIIQSPEIGWWYSLAEFVSPNRLGIHHLDTFLQMVDWSQPRIEIPSVAAFKAYVSREDLAALNELRNETEHELNDIETSLVREFYASLSVALESDSSRAAYKRFWIRSLNRGNNEDDRIGYFDYFLSPISNTSDINFMSFLSSPYLGVGEYGLQHSKTLVITSIVFWEFINTHFKDQALEVQSYARSLLETTARGNPSTAEQDESHQSFDGHPILIRLLQEAMASNVQLISGLSGEVFGLSNDPTELVDSLATPLPGKLNSFIVTLTRMIRAGVIGPLSNGGRFFKAALELSEHGSIVPSVQLKSILLEFMRSENQEAERSRLSKGGHFWDNQRTGAATACPVSIPNCSGEATGIQNLVDIFLDIYMLSHSALQE